MLVVKPHHALDNIATRVEGCFGPIQKTCRSKELIHGVLHGSALHATGPRLCYVISLINLNLSLTNSGSTKILCIMYKDKIHARLYIIKISYVGYQYFVGFAFVMQA